MFRWLTKTKKGFTIVELMIVLLLLSLGAFALINLFRVAHRSFDKSEERYIKQEAVKTAAELLRTGSANVAAAQTADIFADSSVVPIGESIDEGYSYLFAQPIKECETCNNTFPYTQATCDAKSGDSTCGGAGEFAGYFLYVQNKGDKRSEAQQVSDVPMFVEIKPYEDVSYQGADEVENQAGVLITLASLEEDAEYDLNADGSLASPLSSDDIYYSLNVAYHFPNMVTGSSNVAVNYISAKQLSSANTYDSNGNVSGAMYAQDCVTIDANGNYNYTQCSVAHCGCDPSKTDSNKNTNNPHNCADCDCDCPNKMGLVLRIYADSILSGDNTNTSIAVPKLCFVATASYGYDSGEVGLLCDFRDNVLLKTDLGTAFVKAYYKLSPPVADFISEHEGLKAAVRIALKPVVAIAEYSLNEEIRDEGAILLAMFMLSGAGVTATLVTVDKRRKKNKAQ